MDVDERDVRLWIWIWRFGCCRDADIQSSPGGQVGFVRKIRNKTRKFWGLIEYTVFSVKLVGAIVTIFHPPLTL